MCGENNYENISGFFYCTTCQTQSQTHVDMDIEDEDISRYRFGQTLKKDKNRVKENKYGRLWTTTEGFQLIIKEQVKALIGLGANPKLKDIVFDIWVKYLQKTGIAFCSSDSQKIPVIQTYITRSRDAHDFTSKNPYIKPLCRRNKSNPNEFLNKLRYDLHHYRNLERMSMIKTISFCYLGLLYTNNLTTLSDIIRWINIGKIPYMNVSNLFPEDMKFFAEDTITFNSANVPPCRNIRKTCGLLACYLGLSDLPHMPIMELANKYLSQLDLPGELHGMLSNLTFKTPAIWVDVKKSRLLPPYETIAMAYIVVMLKMLFGLDDSTERNLSHFARVYSSYTSGEQKMFIWDDWVIHISKKVLKMKNYRDNLQQNDTFIVQDLDRFLDYCEQMSRSNTRTSVLNERRVNKEDLSNSIRNIFNLITDELKDSNPLYKETLPNTPDDIMDKKIEGSEFRKASVRFITHPKTFLNMNPFNITDSTIHSVQAHHHIESRESEEQDEVDSVTSFVSNSSAVEESSDSSKKRLDRIRHFVIRKVHGAKRQKIDLASRKKLLNLLYMSYKNYVMLPDERITSDTNTQKSLPFTYLWLLYICTSIIEGNCSELDCQVKNIEGLYHIRKISNFRNRSIRNMRRYLKQS